MAFVAFGLLASDVGFRILAFVGFCWLLLAFVGFLLLLAFCFCWLLLAFGCGFTSLLAFGLAFCALASVGFCFFGFAGPFYVIRRSVETIYMYVCSLHITLHRHI